MGSQGSIHGEDSKELLEAQSHLWNHAFSYIHSMALRCAIELAIPDTLHKHGKPMSVSDLSTALLLSPSKTPCLGRLMRLMSHSRLFCVCGGGPANKEEVFSLTSVSRLLVKEYKSTDVSPLMLLVLDQSLTRPWYCLSEWFRGGDEKPSTAFEIAHGMPIWEATSKIGEFNKKLNEGMSSDASFTTEVIVRDCSEVFRGLRSLVDVGGGTGTLARALARAFPTVKCTVLDLPHVVEGLERDKTVRFVGGDMFDHVPSADAALLKWVLHDWSDEECVEILKRCKEAIPVKEDGGKVIIIDMVVNVSKTMDHELAETQYLFDVHMMAHTSGKQRTEQEWGKIFEDAGFRGYKILPILGLRSVIEVYH